MVIVVCVLITNADIVKGELALNATGYIYNTIVLSNISVHLFMFLLKSVNSLIFSLKKYKAKMYMKKVNRERASRKDAEAEFQPEFEFKSRGKMRRLNARKMMEDAANKELEAISEYGE